MIYILVITLRVNILYNMSETWKMQIGKHVGVTLRAVVKVGMWIQKGIAVLFHLFAKKKNAHSKNIFYS